jgi:hypothetical protein
MIGPSGVEVHNCAPPSLLEVSQIKGWDKKNGYKLAV